MENDLKKLSLECKLQTKRLYSNVYKVKTTDTVTVFKYFVNVERLHLSNKGPTKIPIRMSGPEAIRLIRSRVAKEIIRFFTGNELYKGITILYDTHDCLYANEAITETTLTHEVPIESISISDEDRRMVLRDSTKIVITIKSDGGLRNIPTTIRECDREEPNLINFYATLLKSSAPEDQFIGLRGGRLFDMTTFYELRGTGMMRAKGVKMGTKLIGMDQLSVAIDIDSKEGTFYKAQPLIDSVAQYFKCSNQELHRKYEDVYAMQRVERFIRDTAVREEGTHRVFPIGGLKWGYTEEREGTGRQKYLVDWQQEYKNENHYGNVPVVVEEHANEGVIKYTYHPLTALHVLPYSKVPLAKQDKQHRPPALDPLKRFELINKARRDIKINYQNENLIGFGTTVENEPVCPISEIIPAPRISAMKNGVLTQLQTHGVKHSFDPNLSRFVDPSRISSFQIVYDMNEMANESKIRQFGDALFRVCMAKGMSAERTNYHGVWKECEFEKHLESLVSVREKETKNGVVPVYVLVCIGFEKFHDYLKYLEHKYKLICQHVMTVTVKKVLEKGQPTTLHGIAKKLNEKCGGSNVEVTPPIECVSVFPRRTADTNSPISLIIGMDVCHGDPLSKHHENRGMKPDPSIIGISSNALTRNLQMYTGDFIPTQGRREAVPVDVMEEYGRYLVTKFIENHKRLPDNVILVRDGVARSQYEMALGEFAALMDGVRSGVVNSSNFAPREMLIICTKEHNLRLFDVNKEAKTVRNPVPGTVVDSEIVSPFLPEFFLIPHDAFKGTAKGVLVTILKDGDKNLRKYPRESLNEMKYFIHSLCFLHTISDLPSGCPEPVSVSHDLAERGANISKERRRRTGVHLNVNELEIALKTRGTIFEGLKFTA